MKIDKKNNNIFYLLMLLAGSMTVIYACDLFAAQEQSINSQPVVTSSEGQVVVNPTPSTVLAPQGLTTKEQAQLEQQYKYEFRNKAALLSPYIVSGSGGAAEEAATAAAETEQEKLYRYFRAADQLYRAKKFDEAIQILKYIVEKNPDDEYVRSYLQKVEKEKSANKKRWVRTVEGDANLLKNNKIKNLLRDGMDYYKQKDFGAALLRFADVLALDPNNAQAKDYFNKLKGYYLKEVQVKDIVEKAETGIDMDEEESISAGSNPALRVTNEILNEKEREINKSAQKLLNEKESGISVPAEKLLENKESGTIKTAEKMMDEQEMGSIVKKERIGTVLDQAELGLTVEDIIAQKKYEERKLYLYTLGAGDVIQISVRDHAELSGRALVRLNGEIVLPLVNDTVRVKGLTADEAGVKIQDVLKRYVRDPYVTVTIEEYKSKTFYVIDELGCTPYPITRANLTLRDALFVADWGDNRALGRVVVIKPNNLHPIVKKVDAFDIIYRGNLKGNIRIDDGDIVYVPLTVAAKVTKTIADSLQPFAAIRSARDEWINLRGDIKSWKELPRIRQDFSKDAYEDFLWGSSGTATSLGTGQ